MNFQNLSSQIGFETCTIEFLKFNREDNFETSELTEHSKLTELAKATCTRMIKVSWMNDFGVLMILSFELGGLIV